MNYFITSTEDVQTSAIELAEVKRLRVFDYLHQPATIISMLYNFDHQAADEKLGIQGRVLNLSNTTNGYHIILIRLTIN